MQRLLAILAAITWLNVATAVIAQQPQAQQPAEPQRVDARREVIVNWTLGDQAWKFNDVLTTYEPVKGYLESRPNQGHLAVWKLRLVKDLEEGAATLHEKILGSPFKIVLLDAERTIIDPDVPAQISLVSGGKVDDTIELLVGLADAEALKRAKTIRVQRRTDVGF